MTRRAHTLAALALVAQCALLGYAVSRPVPTVPRLVGYGCNGASGTLYANAESDFPPCRQIERTSRRWQGIVETRDGNRYVVEHDVSLDTCLHTLRTRYNAANVSFYAYLTR